MSHEFDLTLDVPENIQSMTPQELVEWAGDRIKPAGSFKPIQVYNIMNNIFMRMGLKLDNEQLLFLLDDSPRVLCEASAGSGKTTVSQLKMIKFKLLYGYDGSDILAIAYNDHAQEDMQKRHTSLIEEIMAQRIQGVKLNDRIVCRTFHSNALAWILEYANKCGISNKDTVIISDANTEKLMDKALENAIKNYNKKHEDSKLDYDKIDPGVITALIAYISYIEETMMSVEDSVTHPKFMEIGLDVEIVADVVTKFNKLCEFNSMFTFSNILVKFYVLLRDNEDIRKRVQGAYKVLLIDEYQDMTPLMNAIVELMLSEDTLFNAIGDGDQSIYSFKGTDSLNCLKFKTYFPNGKVVSMGANRRCRKNIVDVARNILSINQLRYPKDIYSLKDGGSVTTMPYETTAGECEYLISELRRIPVDELYRVCIGYRNRESSLLLSKMLLDARIPFNVRSGYEPYKDMLSASLYDLYAMLKQPLSVAYHKAVLYKICPASRANVLRVIESSKSDGMCHYLDYNWEMLGGIAFSIRKALTTLKECEDAVKSDAPMCNYFGKLWNLFKLYYWNWVSEQTHFSADLESSIISDYSTPRGYKQFSKDYNEQIEIRDRFARSGLGVNLTTFHGLKGLEFDTVYLIDLNDKIFPYYDKIEKDCNGNKQAELELKEECVRLFYVACTRPKDNLICLYDKNNPSIYIDLLRPMSRKEKVAEEKKNTQEEAMDFSMDFDLFEDAEVEEVQSNDVQVFNSDDVDITLDDVTLDDFIVPTEEVVVSEYDELPEIVDMTGVKPKEYPRADHKMYMYHEPSDSYYIIEEGEELYHGSSIDFECSDEISEQDYLTGIAEQEEQSKLWEAKSMQESLKELEFEKKQQDKGKSDNDGSVGQNKVSSTLGIFDFLNS